VALRADAGAGSLGPSRLVIGAPDVATQALRYARLARYAHPVVVNGGPGFLVARDGEPLALIGLNIRDSKITEIDILADPDRLSRLDLSGLLR
jgi:RNA polymerase sigma-70 factor (ECF subfamily)